MMKEEKIEMEVETNNQSKVIPLLVVIIILLVCCVGLLGYKLYFSDNKENINNNENQENETTNQNQNNENTNQNQENNETPVANNEEEEDTHEALTLDNVKEIFNKELDSNAKKITPNITESELKKDFKNLDKSKNNYKILASCTYYNSSAKSCETYKVIVNSAIEYKISLPGCTQTGELYVYNNYLVLVTDEGCSGSTKLFIYDSDNKSVYNNNNIYSIIYDPLDEDYNDIYVKPTISDGKLYFAENTNFENIMNLLSIDLSKNTIKVKAVGQISAGHAH